MMSAKDWEYEKKLAKRDGEYTKSFVFLCYAEMFGEGPYRDICGDRYSPMSDEDFVHKVETCLDSGTPLQRDAYPSDCVI